MASSPEAIPPPGNTPVSSAPPSSPAPAPALQDEPPPTTADPLEPAQSDHAVANPAPPPPPGQATATPPEAHESSAPMLLDGTTDEAAPPPPLFPREVASLASSALETAEPEEPTLPSPRPPVEVVEVSHNAAAVAASPPHSPQVVAASPVDAPPPSPSRSPTASLTGDLPDASSTDSIAMVSEEAARTPQALESMNADPRTAPALLTGPLEVGPEEQHPRPPSPAGHPRCENSEPSQSQLLPPSPPPAETIHALSGAADADAVAVTSEEAVVSPPPALEATDGETDTTPGIPEGSFQEPPSAPMEAEPSSPEMTPPGFGDFKSSWVPLSPHIQSIETAHYLLDAAATTDVAVPEGAAGSVHVLEAMNVKTDAAPDLPPPSSESEAEQPLHQALMRPSSPITQDKPCSPDTPPPGFENFKSSWLPLTDPPLAETTYTSSSDVIATKPVTVTPKEVVWPVPALHAVDVETHTTCSLLPPSESRVEGLLEQPLLRPLTQMVQSAPHSPDMAPPGFENFKSSWAPLSTPLSGRTGTGYVLHDAAVIEPELEAMNGEMHATHSLLLPVQSGVEGSLREPQPRPPSPTTQDAPCSPDMAPPGFENFKSSRILLPPLPLVQTAYTLHNPPASEALNASEEAAQPSLALEAVYVNMDTTPSVKPSSGSGLEGSMPQEMQRLPSPQEKGTACSPEIVPSGHANLQSLQVVKPVLPQLQTPDALADLVASKAVKVELEEVHHPPCILGIKEEGTVLQLEPFAPSLTAQAVDAPPDTPAKNSAAVKTEETAHPPPALQATDKNMDCATTSPPLSENGAEESLPQLQHQLSSPTAQAASCSPDSFQMLPPPPPPFLSKEMGQMVCGGCRELLAYPGGAVHVQCPSCRTINFVLEAHEVGNVHCGQCESLLMYPAGAPAVKCSLCLFVTEIGERNVRPRISVQQAVVPPHPPELTNQG